MTVRIHAILQVLGVLISAGTLLQNGSYIPVKYEPIIVLAVSTLQGIVGLINHYYAPSGVKISS
jgi:hypothetical protein